MAKNNSSGTDSSFVVAPLIVWVGVYSALWALLSNNQGWLIGVIFISAATAVCYHLKLPDPSLKLRHLPSFTVFFLGKLLRGGIDVALRTMSMTPLTRAGWVKYPLQSHDDRVRLMLAALIGLLPGTLTARMEHEQLLIHTLDSEMNWLEDTAQLERHLQKLLSREQHR